MDRRFHKRALSAAAAVLTLTSAVSTASAAQKNEITIAANNNVVKSGDSFELKVGYKPDSIGVSGFTIDLHYDPNAVTLNLSDERCYNVNSRFTLVTNYEYQSGTVRIVGADMSANNVRSETNIAFLSFTVNDGYEGDIAFWTDVDTLVYSYGDSFINADYTAHESNSRYVVTAAPEESEPETTTTVPKPRPAPETATETTTTQTTTTASLPEQIIPETSETSAQQPPDPEDDTVSETVQTDDEQDASSPSVDEPGSAVLFSHTQGNSDYVNEEALQYSFSPYDHFSEDITDEPVDISISVYSSDTVVGGIGMQTSNGWEIFDGMETNGSDIWTANGVDLSDIMGDISVQLFYMKSNSVFEIRDISITAASDIEQTEHNDPEDNEQTEISEPQYDNTQDSDAQPEYAESTADLPVDDTTDSDDSFEADTSQDQNTQDDASSSLPEPASESSPEPSNDTSDLPNDIPNDIPNDSQPNSSSADSSSTADSSSVPGGSTNSSSNSNTDPSSVVNTVNNAQRIANSNPDTGKKLATEFYVAGGLIVASLGQIGYSFYSLGKRNKKNK